MRTHSSIVLTVVFSLLLSACAGTQNQHTDPENDPWEGYNRKVYAFNDGLDKVVRPIAVGYDKIMPDPFQRGVGNFFRNQIMPDVRDNGIDSVIKRLTAGELELTE
jgi:phospholipid-binding lipoprotein MlaA